MNIELIASFVFCFLAGVTIMEGLMKSNSVLIILGLIIFFLAVNY